MTQVAHRFSMARTMQQAPIHPLATAPRRPAGFSLVELLAGTTVAAVLSALAIPAMTGMLVAQQTTSLVNALVASIHFTRGEAIKRNGRAVLCKSADGQTCSASGGWEQGWIVFHDRDNNAVPLAGEPVLLRQGPSPGLRLSGNMPVARYVSYSATGSAKLMSGAFQAGTFTLCPVSGPPTLARLIILSPTGRPRIYKATAADCT